MLRTILYRTAPQADWKPAVLHGFNNSHAILEDGSTGEVFLFEVKNLDYVPNLKFEILTADWIKLQQEAQAAARRGMAPTFGQPRPGQPA